MAREDVTQFVYQNGGRAYAPHCNPNVLHAPGVCEFCDHYPDWQKVRENLGMEFSTTNLPWPRNRPEGYVGFAETLADADFEVQATEEMFNDPPHIHTVVPQAKLRPFFVRDSGLSLGISYYREEKEFVEGRPREWNFGFSVGPWIFGISYGQVI